MCERDLRCSSGSAQGREHDAFAYMALHANGLHICERNTVAGLMRPCAHRWQVPGSACYQEMGTGTIKHGDTLWAIDGVRLYRSPLKLVCTRLCFVHMRLGLDSLQAPLQSTLDNCCTN